MFCGQCGTERTSEDARFCRSCGADLAASVPPSVTEQRDNAEEVTTVRPVVMDPRNTAQLTPPTVSLGGWPAPTAAPAPAHPSPSSYSASSARGFAPSPAGSSPAAGESRLPLYAAALVLLVVGGLIGYVAVTWLLPL